MFLLPKTNGQRLDVLSSPPVHALKDTHSETMTDAGVFEAVSEACYTLLAFGAAVAAIQLLKQRNSRTKCVRDAARKAEKLNIQIPSMSLPDTALPTPKDNASADSMRSRVSGAREPK